MKTIKLNVIKKNRKYFECRTSNGYKARLIIDSNSENLELGEQDLPVNDKSKRTKYGVDIILELAADAEEIKSAGIVTLSHHIYNQDLVEQCRALGGQWDSDENCWVMSDIVADKVEELDDIYNSDLIPIEISVAPDSDGDKNEICGHASAVRFLGYTIARATGRDSGAKMGDNVSFIKGTYRSGGSVKNWKTVVSDDSVVRIKVPTKLLDIYIDNVNNIVDGWEVKKL